MDFSKIYKTLGNKFPQRLQGYIQTKLTYAGIDTEAGLWIGSRFLLIALFGLAGMIGYLNLDRFGYAKAMGIFLAVSVVLMAIVYIRLFFAITKRTAAVERVLPDFLMLIVSNLHAGMAPFSAFIEAARPEFGSLYHELSDAASRVGGKRSIDAALIALSERFDSEIFRKTVRLFLKGIKSGGQLAKLIASNADEIRRIQDLRAELITTTKTYTIFLGFIVVVVMPFLLGVSASFLQTFTAIQSQVSAGNQTTTIFTGKIGVTPKEMEIIAIATLAITSLFASLFMGIVSVGKPVYGLKYYPFLIVGALIFFFMTKSVLAKIIILGN